MRIFYGTNVVTEDEPCLGLAELIRQSPGNKGFHRYQIIHVMRGDKVVEYQKDMGAAEDFANYDSFNIPGGAYDEHGKLWIEHNVGELVQIAEQLRGNPAFDKVELAGVDKIRH